MNRSFAENGGMFRYVMDSVRRTLFSPAPIGIIEPHRRRFCPRIAPAAEAPMQKRIGDGPQNVTPCEGVMLTVDWAIIVAPG